MSYCAGSSGAGYGWLWYGRSGCPCTQPICRRMVPLASRAVACRYAAYRRAGAKILICDDQDSWWPAPAQDMASELFGVAGLRVTEVGRGPDGTLEVWAVTDHPAAGPARIAGTPARRAHERVLARPRDVRRGADGVAVSWVKRGWKCDELGCARKTFTE